MIDKIKAQFKFDKKFLASGIIVFSGSMIVNVINYLFHLVLGRSLGPADYGVAVSLISFLAILSLPLSTITTVVTKYSSESYALKKYGQIAYLYKKINKYLLIIGIALVALIIIFANQIGNFLQIEPLYIRLVSIFLIFAFLASVTRGILQGVKKFKSYTYNLIIEVAVKLIFFLILFYFGLKITGFIYAFVGSMAIAYLISLLPIKKFISASLEKINLRSFFGYSTYALLALSTVSALTYFDVLLVKHYFSAEEAGYYAALATVGKIVLFLAMPIITVMFPYISEAHTKNERHFHLLAQTTGIICLMSAAVLAAYYFFPELIIKILYGSKFIVVSNYLFLFGLAMFMLTLVNILIYYFLSIKKLSFVWIVILSAVGELLLIYFRHGNIQTIIYNLLITFSFLFVSLFILYVYLKKERIKEAFLSL